MTLGTATGPSALRVWALAALLVAISHSTVVAWDALGEARGVGPGVLPPAILAEVREVITADGTWALEQQGEVVCLQLGDRRATDLHLTLQLELAPALSVCSLTGADIIVVARDGVATGWRRP